MSKYRCDNWSWSSRRCDPKLRDRDANKENQPISPLSRLADRVDDSRRWAPIPDRWHNHCEWLVDHHQKLRKRFRKTTANDRLSGVLTTLKCTRDRIRSSSEEDGSVIGSKSRCKRVRNQVNYPELEPASTWLGTVHPELFQHKLLSPLEVPPFKERDDEMEIKTQKPELECMTDDAANQATHRNPSSDSIESIAENSNISEASVDSQAKGASRSQSPVGDTFEPESFRTSTPTANDSEEPSKNFRRSSAWKDYVMSHDPILFRSYVDTHYPKKSWRHCHQKLAERHGGKYRRSSSGRIRKPPTPKSLRVSWNSLDDVVHNEGILKSPLHLPPILPCEATPPMDIEDDHGSDIEHDEEASMPDNSNDQIDLRDIIGDGIRAIRKNCKARDFSADDSYAAGDERDSELGIDPSDLSDISFGEEREVSNAKTEYDLDDVSSDGDIDDICRIVNKELHHDDHHPDDILTNVSFDILDDLEVDSKYPPNYFRAGFADRTVRRRKIKKTSMIINSLDPQARSFKPRFTPDMSEDDNADQRIVEFADRKTPDQDRNEHIPDVLGSGTKFYPSDVRFRNKDGFKKFNEILKAFEDKPKAIVPVPVPVTAPFKRVDLKPIQQRFVQECESKRKKKAEVKEDNCNGQQTSRDEVVGKAAEIESSITKAEAEQDVSEDTNEKTSCILKPIAKGKAKRQVAHKISVVMGRRAWKPSNDFEKNPGEDIDGHTCTGSWSPAAGDVDNVGVVPKRTPQLRQIEVQHGDASVLTDNNSVVASRAVNAVEKGQTASDINMIPEDQDKLKAGPTVQKVPARTEENVQSHSYQTETSMRNLDVNSPRHSALMMQRLALLKESHGNSSVDEARPGNLPDGGLQEKHDSQRMTMAGKGVSSNPSEHDRRHGLKLEPGHRGIEKPDENNNRAKNDVPQAKKNHLPKIANAENNDKTNNNNGREISENRSGCKQNEIPCKKTHGVKDHQSESLVNVERTKPLVSKQNEVRGSRALSEAVRDNPPPQPLIQNPPHRYPYPQHNMNPSMHPNMHPNMHPDMHPNIQGNTPLYQHPPDQQPRGPFNPNLSAYHHHQMALRAAAMQYYSHQRHMVMQRHHPGFYPQHQQHQHAMNMQYRPEWNNMPGPGPPR